ncbi:Ricin B-like lectin EULS3 [Linum perenne]
MEFPGSHHHHHVSHHHNRRDDSDDEDERRSGNFYPPPGSAAFPPQPPAPYSHNEFGSGHHYPTPPQSEPFYEAPPPPPKPFREETQVFHVPPQPYGGSGYDNPTPNFPPPQTHHHESSYGGSGYDNPNPSFPPQPTHHHESSYGGSGYDNPTPNFPPQQTHHQESSYGGIGHNPPKNYPSQVTHVSHDPMGGATHHSSGPVPGLDLASKPSHKVYSKANPDFNLTIRDGKVLMARADPHDPYQSWFKDERYSTRVKDEEGSPCFALVNKATGQAMKHSVGASHPVQLIPYKPDMLDESVLWAQSKDMGEGFRTIRMVNNIRLNVDAFHGDKKSGGVRDGTTIVLWQWNKGDNQLWKIVRQ